MAEDNAKSPFEQIIEALLSGGVEFIVVGGQAENIMGSPRVTYDVDLCYRRTRDNLQRLAIALKSLNPTLRNAPPDLPFHIDAQSLALGCNFTFKTTLGDLDLLGFLEPLGDYDAVVKNAQAVAIGETTVNVISLDDLIKIKEFIRRPKDQESLFQLRAIKKIQTEGK